MGYALLAAAISLEVAATLSLRASDGFTKPLFVVVIVLGYAGAFACLGFALKRGVPLGIAYGIWSAVGVTIVAVLSKPLFGETLAPVQVGGIALIAVGVIALEMGKAH